MESKELEEVVLPVQLLEMIALEAEEVTKEKSKGGSKDFALGFQHGYFIGATEWAQWFVKHNAIESELYGARAENERLKAKLSTYHGVKERCDKMAEDIQLMLDQADYSPEKAWYEIICNMKGIGLNALDKWREGESNTPAPGEGEKEVKGE